MVVDGKERSSGSIGQKEAVPKEEVEENAKMEAGEEEEEKKETCLERVVKLIK